MAFFGAPMKHPRRGRAKFRVGQVVMVIQASADGGKEYPVKLDHRTSIGERYDTAAWMDTLDNEEYECEMRPLTAREKGSR